MFSDGIITLQQHEDLEVKTVHFQDPKNCFELVRLESEAYWKHKANRKAEENYRFGNGTNWSLEAMLKNGGFELGYTLLYINGEFFAAGGARRLNESTSISLSRFFCKSSSKPLGNAFILPIHIEASRRAGFTKTIITFNEYNAHLARYYEKVLKTRTDSVSRLAYSYLSRFQPAGLQEINNVQQYVFEYDLTQNE